MGAKSHPCLNQGDECGEGGRTHTEHQCSPQKHVASIRWTLRHRRVTQLAHCCPALGSGFVPGSKASARSLLRPGCLLKSQQDRPALMIRHFLSEMKDFSLFSLVPETKSKHRLPLSQISGALCGVSPPENLPDETLKINLRQE